MLHARKVSAFILLILAISFSSDAQKTKVKWGAKVSDEKETKFNIIGVDDNSVYILRFQHDKRNYSIPYFVILDKKTMEVSSSKEMQVPVPEEGDARIHNVYYLKDHFILMISVTNSKTKKDIAIAYHMSKKGEIDSNYKIVLETTAPERGLYLDYNFMLTPDSSKFLAVVESDDIYLAASFDPALNGLWTGSFNGKTVSNTKYVHTLRYATDMNNDLFILAKASSKGAVSNQQENKLFVYKHQEKKAYSYDLQPPGKDIAYENGDILCDVNGGVRVVSFYGEKDTDAKGYLLSSYADGKVKTTASLFSPRFYAAFMSDSKSEKATKEDFLQIDYVVMNKDQSFEVVMHKYAPRVFVAAVVTKFDKDFKEAWSAPLPVYYWYDGDYYTYTPMLTDHEICFLHNDHKKNMDTVDPRESTGLTGMADAVSVLTRVDLQTGKVTKQKLFEANELGTHVMPRKCYQADEHEMYLFAKRGSNVNFGKLTVE